MLDWLIGIIGSAAVAGAAYWRQALSGSGAAAAVVVGTVLYAAGGAAWFVPLIVFFLTSTLLSKWRRRQKAHLESAYEKSGRRDAGQVLANGGVGALLCAVHAAFPHPLWWVAYVGVTATVNADTWATEVGGLSGRPPRSIVTGQPVPPGTSGGVSAPGLLASAAGALLIGLVSVPFAGLPVVTVPLATVAGFAGALVDSLLGATLQQMRRCTSCGREVEAATHCGRPTRLVRGLRGLNNDAVNCASSIAGGAISVGIMLLLLHA